MAAMKGEVGSTLLYRQRKISTFAMQWPLCGTRRPGLRGTRGEEGNAMLCNCQKGGREIFLPHFV